MSGAEPIAAGTVLGGRYRLGEPIGQGGMGRVFRATDLQLARAVAVKLILPAYARRADAEARFRREATIGAGLAHPGVVRIYDVGRDAGRLFLVMELVEGSSLADYRDRHAPLPLEAALAVAGGIADALAAAHEQGLVHRDVKPENVLLVGDDPGAVRLLDFGMAIAPAGDDVTGRLTRDGTVGGTPQYMAPEQAAGRTPAPPIDVYSLGCVLFELLTGRLPFEADSSGLLLARHLYAAIPSVRAARPELHAALDELVARMMAKQPEDRPAMRRVCHRLATIRAPEPPGGAQPVGSGPHAALLAPARGGGAAQGPRVVLVTGSDEELEVALRAAGCDIVPASEAGRAECAVALGADLETLARLAAGSWAVVGDLDPRDTARRTALIRAGVDDVVTRPIQPEALVAKVQRAVRLLRERNTVH